MSTQPEETHGIDKKGIINQDTEDTRKTIELLSPMAGVDIWLIS